VHDRSILLALEACEFFEIADEDARQMICETARRVSDEWGEALARQYETAFMNDQTEIAMRI